MRTFDNINKCLYIFDNVNNFLRITYITNGFKYSSEKIVLNIKGSLQLYIIYLYIPKQYCGESTRIDCILGHSTLGVSKQN